MKKISNFSIAGLLFGFFFSLFSGIRYFILWPDEDRAIVYVLLGILIMIVSWLYNMLYEQGKDIAAIEDYLREINNSELDKTPEQNKMEIEKDLKENDKENKK